MTFFRLQALCAVLVFGPLCPFACTCALAQPTATSLTKSSSEIPKPQLTPEAQVATRRGVEYLKTKEYKKAIEIFKLAARMHPRQSALRHMLGFAYAQDKQLGQAWLQFRQAVRLDPSYAAGVRDFLSLWQAFENRGVFNCGRTSEEITKLLGKPDKVVPNGANEVWEYGFKQIHFTNGRLAAVIDPRGLSHTIANANNKLEIEFDDQSRWRLGYRSVDRIQSLTEYIPAGQAVGTWNELYTIQRIHNLAKTQTPSEMMKNIETNLKQANPDVEFVVLSERDGDVLFHWRDVGSKLKKRKPQHEIVRLLAGDRDIHRLAYAQRVAQIPPETAKNWATILSQANLVATPTPTVPSSPQR